MKYLALCVGLAFGAGCAHVSQGNPVAKEAHRKQVAQVAWDYIEKEIDQKAELYGSLVQGSRFLLLADMEMTKDAEAGVIVVNAFGEQHEQLGRIFIYLFCDPKGTCVIAQVASKSVMPVEAPPTRKDETSL